MLFALRAPSRDAEQLAEHKGHSAFSCFHYDRDVISVCRAVGPPSVATGGHDLKAAPAGQTSPRNCHQAGPLPRFCWTPHWIRDMRYPVKCAKD